MPITPESNRLLGTFHNSRYFPKFFDAFCKRIFHRRPDTTGECHELRRRQKLIPKEHRQMVQKRLSNPGDRVRAKVAGQVRTENFGAQSAGDGANVKRGGHD